MHPSTQAPSDSLFAHTVFVEELGTYVGGASEKQAAENARLCVEWLQMYRKGAKTVPWSPRKPWRK